MSSKIVASKPASWKRRSATSRMVAVISALRLGRPRVRPLGALTVCSLTSLLEPRINEILVQHLAERSLTHMQVSGQGALVAGAGLIGSAVARHLAKAGAFVTVV